jgi:hypothetical protein
MNTPVQGFPAPATSEQVIFFAQLQILRRLEAQRRLH